MEFVLNLSLMYCERRSDMIVVDNPYFLRTRVNCSQTVVADVSGSVMNTGILSSSLPLGDIYIDLAHRCPYLLLPKGVWGSLAASVVVWVALVDICCIWCILLPCS